MQPRYCRIVVADVGADKDADGDGVEQLIMSRPGLSPEAVGQRIGEALQEVEMLRGARGNWYPDSGPLYFKIVVKVTINPDDLKEEGDDDE